MSPQPKHTPLEQIKIEFRGIGEVIKAERLQVPTYQRDYAWEKEHVEEFLGDLAEAMQSGESEYFIGSIVLTAGQKDHLHVTDGQQRLATASIMFAAIRNYFLENEEEERASEVENAFLLSRELRSRQLRPRLCLNAHDQTYFESVVLDRPDSQGIPNAEALSHKRLQSAVETVTDYLNKWAGRHSKDSIDALIDWVEYLEESCKVIQVIVPDDGNAFTIFETLDDRGLDLAISDLLKNFLFHKASNRQSEAQNHWTTMTGILEATSEDKVLVTYLRHYWSSVHGLTRERDLYKEVKQRVSSVMMAVDLSEKLSANSAMYAALSNASHELWRKYGSTTQGHVATLNLLRMVRMRPLLLAMVSDLSMPEAKKALKYIVDLAVRNLIVGGRAGTLEGKYCEVAKDIRDGKVKTASQLRRECSSIFPSDKQFRDSFIIATTSKPYLARYYLRALERASGGESHPEFVPNPNSDAIDLEHVLPQKPHANWPGFSSEQRKAMCPRFGNLVLMKSEDNSVAGNAKFTDKKKLLRKSSFKLTKSVAKNAAWGENEIMARQTELASLAVKTWSGKFA